MLGGKVISLDQASKKFNNIFFRVKYILSSVTAHNAICFSFKNQNSSVSLECLWHVQKRTKGFLSCLVFFSCLKAVYNLPRSNQKIKITHAHIYQIYLVQNDPKRSTFFSICFGWTRQNQNSDVVWSTSDFSRVLIL